MIRRPPRSTPKPSSAASDVYKRQDISFNILLNDDFSGGGTRFFRRSNGAADDEGGEHKPFALGQPSPGDCLLHGSQVLHEGFPIQSGVRIIIVGFFAVDRVDPFTGSPNRLSFLSSWFSLSWLQVKLKDAYTFSDRRKEASSSRRNSAFDERDHELARCSCQAENRLLKGSESGFSDFLWKGTSTHHLVLPPRDPYKAS